MPQYTRIGISDDNEDLLDILAKVSKNSFSMFTLLKKERNPHTNMTTLQKCETPSETNAQNLALRELEAVNLIHRVGARSLRDQRNKVVQVAKRTFLINPLYLFPRTNEDFEIVFNYWNQLEPYYD